MDAQKVDMFLLSNQKNLPAGKIPLLREQLLQMDESKYAAIASVEFKDSPPLLIISIFLGSLGIDRFMLGDIGLGVLKLLTCGVCGILTIVDWFSVQNRTRDLNFNNLQTVLIQMGATMGSNPTPPPQAPNA